jgi:hypothetical protein
MSSSTQRALARRRRGLVACAALLAIAVVAPTVAGAAGSGPAATASAAKPVLFSKQCANGSFKPTRYVIACADASIIFKAKEYAQWDPDEALASGVLTYPACAPRVPLVACDMFGHDRATVRLFRPTFCPKKGRQYFTRLLMFDSEAPDKSLRRIKLKFPCSDVK